MICIIVTAHINALATVNTRIKLIVHETEGCYCSRSPPHSRIQPSQPTPPHPPTQTPKSPTPPHPPPLTDTDTRGCSWPVTHPWPSPRSPSVTSLAWRTWSARSHPSPSTRYYAVPDTALPDTALPDTAVPDTAVPDTAVPDTAVPDTAVPDTRPRSLLCVRL